MSWHDGPFLCIDTVTAPCMHGMPSPSSCVDCMDDGNLERLADDQPLPTGATLTARYDGDCREVT